jgi:hypothetical protein
MLSLRTAAAFHQASMSQTVVHTLMLQAWQLVGYSLSIGRAKSDNASAENVHNGRQTHLPRSKAARQGATQCSAEDHCRGYPVRSANLLG